MYAKICLNETRQYISVLECNNNNKNDNDDEKVVVMKVDVQSYFLYV